MTETDENIEIKLESEDNNDELIDEALNGEKNLPKNDDLPPDSYLNRNEFSSERYKIELKNLPKNFGFSVSFT